MEANWGINAVSMYVKDRQWKKERTRREALSRPNVQRVSQVKKLYVTNLGVCGSPREAERWLLSHFQLFGRVVDMKVLTGAAGQIFGFVAFEEEETVIEALNHVHRVCDGVVQAQRAQLWVNECSQSNYVPQAVKVFVGGIPNNCSLGEFKQYFAGFGKIEDTFLPIRDGLNQGFGFVTFADTHAVSRLFAERSHFLRGKWLDIKVARPRRSDSPNYTALAEDAAVRAWGPVAGAFSDSNTPK